MCFIKWCNKKIKKFNWVDVQFIKLSVIAFTLMFAKLVPEVLYLEWYYYLIMFILFAIVPISKIFKK